MQRSALCRSRRELSNEYLLFTSIYLQNLASIQPASQPASRERALSSLPALRVQIPQVKQELNEALCSAVRKKKPVDHGTPSVCGTWNPRAFVLYHYYPYNRSSWYKMKDPVWWIFTIIAATQLYCIRAVWSGKRAEIIA